MRRRSSRSRPGRALTDMSRLQKLIWAARAADRAARRQPLVGERLRGRCSASPSASRCRSRPRSAARICSIRITPATPATSASAPIPKLLARVKGADLIILVGGRLGEMPSQGYTLLDIPAPTQTFVHVHPGVGELGRVYRAASCDQRRADRVCGRARRPAAAERSALARRDAGRARRFPRLDRQADAGAGRGQSRRDHRVAARQASGRRGHHQRRRQLLGLGASLLRATAATARSSRRSPAPWATACRPRSA